MKITYLVRSCDIPVIVYMSGSAEVTRCRRCRILWVTLILHVAHEHDQLRPKYDGPCYCTLFMNTTN
jgi:hypothetical protein